MAPIARAFDSVHFYIDEFTSKVVAKSGIPSDRFHLGKLILEGLREHPEFIVQIDGATGESDSSKSVLEKTIKCAISLQRLGLKKGDVLAIIAPNHLNLCIPMYAALCLGLPVVAMDHSLGAMELNGYFVVLEPKIIFCHNVKLPTIKQALNDTNVNPSLITFDDSEDCTSFNEFINKYSNDSVINNFTPEDFDAETTLAYLTTTSGTTGLPKVISLSHKNMRIAIPYIWTNFTTFPTPTKLVLVLSPAHWLSAGFHYLFSPILKFTRLQSSKPATEDIIVNLINKYRPTFSIFSPTLISSLLKGGIPDICDFSCFDYIILGGSYVSEEVVTSIKEIVPRAKVTVGYGQSEVGGIAVQEGSHAHGSVGRPNGAFDYRLVNIDTLEDIDAPFVNGELWLKGPAVSMGYYRNPEETKATFVEDGWLRTGDIMYRDEEGHLYFVERIKLLLKYKSYHVSPTELEGLIRQHPGVSDVAVVGIEDEECGDLIVACVVPKTNYKVTAQEIKDLVKDNLSDAKQLRGGVIFMEEMPMTSTTKVDRRKLKELVRNMPRD